MKIETLLEAAGFMEGAMQPKVAVLYARADSIYKQMVDCDVYDIERDARTYPGGLPVVAHPPCRAWGRLRHFAKPRDDEKLLAIDAVAVVRREGGVLEHPAESTLWDEPDLDMPQPSKGRDKFGGFTLAVNQHWWGHRADKATWLYICGCEPSDVERPPLVLGKAEFVVKSSRKVHKGGPRHITKREREATPVAFAAWLVRLALKCKKEKNHVTTQGAECHKGGRVR